MEDQEARENTLSEHKSREIIIKKDLLNFRRLSSEVQFSVSVIKASARFLLDDSESPLPT